MKNKLPKLEVHFGDEVLHIPQNKKVNLITFAFKRDTLKESIIECYRMRTLDVIEETGIEKDYDDITFEEIEAQLVKDLKEFGDNFVFDIAWKEGDAEIVGVSQMSFYEWMSDEEELFVGKVEEVEETMDR